MNATLTSVQTKTSRGETVMELKNVSKRYPGMLAVDSVSMKINAGEVHALLGENGAGKSTLMKIIAGSFNDYTGDINLNGQSTLLHTPQISKSKGVGMIYQELSLAGPISIAENINIGRLPKKFGFVVDRKMLVQRTQELLAQVGLDLDVDKTVDYLSPHEGQLVEIAKALGDNPQILVMDEPTSSLSHSEVELLFTIIEKLKAQGLAIIYISHHLPEVFRIADRVTVMRDGRKVFESGIEDVTPEILVQQMVGDVVKEVPEVTDRAIGDVRLSVNNLSRAGYFKHISFEARQGEVLGISGLAGSGRSEIARALCGLDRPDSGKVILDGEEYTPKSLIDSMDRGLCYLTEDRKQQGLFLRTDIRENILASLIKRHSKFQIYHPHDASKITEEMIRKMEIMPADDSAQVSNLSGGNQQKILLAKWLAIKPKVLILDEPTRGVDVGAKNLIHETVLRLAHEEGTTVILISSDLPELVRLSDRCLVIKEGCLIDTLPKNKLTEENVLLRAYGEQLR